MKADLIEALSTQLVFTPKQYANKQNISLASAQVACSRSAKTGFIKRLKKDLYITAQRWQYATQADFFKLANYIQVPSYISYLTALSFYEVTTQIPQAYYESASQKRSICYDIANVHFDYKKLKPSYYFGFYKQNDFFIASKEKALVDCLYLQALGRYELDPYAIDFKQFDVKILTNILTKYPKRIVNDARSYLSGKV